MALAFPHSDDDLRNFLERDTKLKKGNKNKLTLTQSTRARPVVSVSLGSLANRDNSTTFPLLIIYQPWNLCFAITEVVARLTIPRTTKKRKVRHQPRAREHITCMHMYLMKVVYNLRTRVERGCNDNFELRCVTSTSAMPTSSRRPVLPRRLQRLDLL